MPDLIRKRFNLDTAELKGFMIHVHGGYGYGKTHLEGDFLRTEAKEGPVRFLNIIGEDGNLTLKGMGLGEIAEDVDSYDLLQAILKDYTGLKLQALALDTSNALALLLMRKVVGSDRLPAIQKGSNEWGEFHHLSRNVYTQLRRAAKYVMVTCPSDNSVDQITGKTFITPDLPGRQAAGSAGWFDFQGYLDLVVSAGGSTRTFNMVKNNNTVVRQRLPKEITEVINIPNGSGGWLAIKTAIEKGWK